MALTKAPNGNSDRRGLNGSVNPHSLLMHLLRRRTPNRGRVICEVENKSVDSGVTDVREERRGFLRQMDLPGMDIAQNGTVEPVSCGVDGGDDSSGEVDDEIYDETGDERELGGDTPGMMNFNLGEIRSSELFGVFLELSYSDLMAMQSDEERLFIEEVIKRLVEFFAREIGVDDGDISDLTFSRDPSGSERLKVDFKLNVRRIGVGAAVMKLGGLMRKMGSGSWRPLSGDIFEVDGIVLGDLAVSALSS